MGKRNEDLVPFTDLIRSCLHLLDRRDRVLLIASGILQMSLVFLDLLGVLLLGSIVAIATSAVQGRPLPGIINQSIDHLRMLLLLLIITALRLGNDTCKILHNLYLFKNMLKFKF